MIQPGELLHIYNQGNNKQKIFFEDENYLFFLQKVRHFLLPTVDILAYCLMPNHFHFLVYTNPLSCKILKVGAIQIQSVSNALRSMQSSYAQAINKRYKRSGSLFRQKTKMKLLTDENHLISCFHYIHQNPMKARLVNKLEDWKYSSFCDYYQLNTETFCNQSLAEKLLRIDKTNFYRESYAAIKEASDGLKPSDA